MKPWRQRKVDYDKARGNGLQLGHGDEAVETKVFIRSH